MTRHAPAAAVAALLSLLAAAAPAQQDAPAAETGNAADAQDFGADRIGAVLDAITDPEATAREVGDAITPCLKPLDADAPPHAPVIFDVTFDENGAPGPAKLVIPPPAAAERIHTRQLIRAEAAVFACAPIEVGGSAVRDVTLRLLAEEDSIQVWDNQLPPQDATAASPLKLSRADRREVQTRLGLAGFDPRGTDGIFGPNTRAALRAWQQARDFPATGTLDRTQLDRLRTETQDAYEAQQARAARQRNSTPSVYRGEDGCLRYADGRIVPRRSLRCDVRGLITGGG